MQRPDIGDLTPPNRTLMGPGPSEVHPRVLRSMATPMLGYLDPAFLSIMDDIQELLRYAFRTDNEWTFAISGTGSAGMEALLYNLIEPGETALVPDNGYFGGRMAEMASRAGADVHRVSAPWGEALDPGDVERAVEEHDPDLFAFVHAETSTGVLQPNVPELVEIARANDALVVADTVTSLGGVELRIDEWGIDAAYSAAQKCLSAPPGASPVTLNERAVEKVRSREEPPRSWYVDLELLSEYWGEPRNYHHTAPMSAYYALREALRLAAEEGIEERWKRHEEVAGVLRDGLEDLGLELNASPECWLPSLNAVRVPEGIDDGAVTSHLLEEYDIEIAGGLGDLAGEVWRIGCMGHSAREANVHYLLAALEDALSRQR